MLGQLHDDLDTCPRVRDADDFPAALGGQAETGHVPYDAIEVVGIVDAESEREKPAPVRRYESQLVASVPAGEDPR